MHSVRYVECARRMPSCKRITRVNACERETSATGHFAFSEFANAAALPFARRPRASGCTPHQQPPHACHPIPWHARNHPVSGHPMIESHQSHPSFRKALPDPRDTRLEAQKPWRWIIIIYRCRMTSCLRHMQHISTRHRPGEYMRRERENSSTGHIGFLEFINAAALPFARKPCNIDNEPVFNILSFMRAPLFSVFHTDIPKISRLTNPPTTHDQLCRSSSTSLEPSKPPIEEGRAGGAPTSATRAGHLASVWLARAHSQLRLSYGRSTRA